MLPSYPIISPAIPFEDIIVDGLQPWSLITIQGSVPQYAQDFVINLASGHNDGSNYLSAIPFHFNVRLNQGYVARNTYRYNRWGPEEGSRHESYFPFQRGGSFEITILVNSNDFKVSVNGGHFTDYRHRIPYQEIKYIQILKDVSIQSILLQRDASFGYRPPIAQPVIPSHSLPSSSFYDLHPPFEKIIPGGLYAGKKISISGRPSIHAHRFHIDLYYGDTIALHLSVRFDEKAVVRNTQERNTWQTEERHAQIFPFQRGAYFDMLIECDPVQYLIKIGGTFFCSFVHRLPFARVNMIKVYGDVVINSLIFQ